MRKNRKTKLQRPPSYELFFAPLVVTLDPKDIERIQFAYFASKYGHAMQVRDDGTRYFDHPKAATWIYIHELGGRDPRLIIALLLHDLSEDAYLLSWYRVRLNFGEDVARDQRALTKLPEGKETTEEYLRRVIVQGPWAMVAKLCDRLHNLRTLATASKEKRIRQVRETRAYHLKMLVPALVAAGGEWSTYAKLLERMIKAAIRQIPLR